MSGGKDAFDTYLELLQKWNTRYNLTSIRDLQRIRSHHFQDSLAPLPFVGDANTLIDLGTGAGFPGIPLKIEQPDLDITLLDAKRKKVSFCNEVIRTLGLEGIRAIQGRAEDPEMYESLGKFDVVISRATWPLENFLSVAIHYMDDKGKCIAMRGAKWRDELNAAGDIISKHKFRLIMTHQYSIGDNEKRCLVIFTTRTSQQAVR